MFALWARMDTNVSAGYNRTVVGCMPEMQKLFMERTEIIWALSPVASRYARWRNSRGGSVEMSRWTQWQQDNRDFLAIAIFLVVMLLLLFWKYKLWEVFAW